MTRKETVMGTIGIYHNDIHLIHKTPKGHADPPSRLKNIEEAIKREIPEHQRATIQPRKATTADILRVHTNQYLKPIEQARPGYMDYKEGIYISEGTYEAALHSAGSLLQAIDDIKSQKYHLAYSITRPAGHHAESNRMMGYCIFNNVAIAARYAQQKGYKKVLIIDHDLHHGNGTQEIFESDPTVFFFDTHQSNIYPGTGHAHEEGIAEGTGYTMNVPIPPGSGDTEYIKAYEKKIPKIKERFRPDLIMVSAGYDMMEEDCTSDMLVTKNGLKHMVEAILGDRKTPAIFALEGGYDPESIARCIVTTLTSSLG